MYEISVRSMNIDDRRPTTDLRAYSHTHTMSAIAISYTIRL